MPKENEDAVNEESIVTDGTQAIVDAVNKADETNLKTSTKNDDSGLIAENAIAEILSEHGLESMDDLGEQLNTLAGLKSDLGQDSIRDLKKTKKLMDDYQEHWAKEAEESESENETISRLKKENEQLSQDASSRKAKRDKTVAAQKVLNNFGKEVDKAIKADSSVPKEFRRFLSEFMGVENPINKIDMADKRKIQSTTKAGIKKFKALEQTIIKNYLKTKGKVPPMSSSQETADSQPKKIKNIADAKALAHEKIAEAFRTAEAG